MLTDPGCGAFQLENPRVTDAGDAPPPACGFVQGEAGASGEFLVGGGLRVATVKVRLFDLELQCGRR